jgi:hypothetical protein
LIVAAKHGFRRSAVNDQGTQTDERDPKEHISSPPISLCDHDQQGGMQTAFSSDLKDRTSTPENSVRFESPPLSDIVPPARYQTRGAELESAYIKYLEAELEEAHKVNAKCKKDIKKQVDYHLNQQAALALHDQQHDILLKVSQHNLDLQARYSALLRWAHSLDWENASLREQIVLIMQQYDGLRVGPYAPATCAAESKLSTDVK